MSAYIITPGAGSAPRYLTFPATDTGADSFSFSSFFEIEIHAMQE